MPETLKVLLHGPFHPTIWFYIMKSMPEHEFYLTRPTFGFQSLGERGIENMEDLYHVYNNEEVDVQVICLHLKDEGQAVWHDALSRHYPIVWFQNWNTDIPLQHKKYPLIYTSKTNHTTDYPRKQHIWIAPHPEILDVQWIGDWDKILISSRLPHMNPEDPYISFIHPSHRLEHTHGRTLTWNEWKTQLAHCRIFMDLNFKHSSTEVIEAMTIGAPVIARPTGDNTLMIRNGVDGYTTCSYTEYTHAIMQLFYNHDKAREQGMRAKKRAMEISSVENNNKVFNTAFTQAIQEGKW